MARICLKAERTALRRWLGVSLATCALIIIAFVLMLRQNAPGSVETLSESGRETKEAGGPATEGGTGQNGIRESAVTGASRADEPGEASEPTQSSWDLLKQFKLDSKWAGDLDELVKRRLIRALVVGSRTMYFLDGARERGVTYEALKEFEKEINQKLRTGNLPVYVVFIPVNRDELLPGLVEGRGDIAAANLTVTPERAAIVDFSVPVLTGVSELVVTGPGAPTVSRIEDLAGKEVHVRPSSSYRESLEQLNQ